MLIGSYRGGGGRWVQHWPSLLCSSGSGVLGRALRSPAGCCARRVVWRVKCAGRASAAPERGCLPVAVPACPFLCVKTVLLLAHPVQRRPRVISSGTVSYASAHPPPLSDARGVRRRWCRATLSRGRGHGAVESGSLTGRALC